MSNVKHLDHLNLTVTNLEESQRWYANIFGFERVESGVHDGVVWAILRSGDALLALYERPDLPFTDRFTRPVQGLNHFAIRIRDRDDWEAVVKRHDVPVDYGGAYDWPHSTSWYIADGCGSMATHSNHHDFSHLRA